MGPCVAYCLCFRVGSVAVAVPAPTIFFAPLSIVTAIYNQSWCHGGQYNITLWESRALTIPAEHASAVQTVPVLAHAHSHHHSQNSLQSMQMQHQGLHSSFQKRINAYQSVERHETSAPAIDQKRRDLMVSCKGRATLQL